MLEGPLVGSQSVSMSSRENQKGGWCHCYVAFAIYICVIPRRICLQLHENEARSVIWDDHDEQKDVNTLLAEMHRIWNEGLHEDGVADQLLLHYPNSLHVLSLI